MQMADTDLQLAKALNACAAPQIRNSGPGWLPADRGPLLAYPLWLAGEWRVTRVRLERVAFPLGQRYVNRLTPGALHICAIECVCSGRQCLHVIVCHLDSSMMRVLVNPAGTWTGHHGLSCCSVLGQVCAVAEPGDLFQARKHAGVTKASLIAALADVGASQDHAVTYRERYVASADGRSAAPDRSASLCCASPRGGWSSSSSA